MFSPSYILSHSTEGKGLKLCSESLICEVCSSKFGGGFIHLKDMSLIASEVIIFNMTRKVHKCDILNSC